MYLNLHNLESIEIESVRKFTNRGVVHYTVNLEILDANNHKSEIALFAENLEVFKGAFKVPPVTEVTK